MALSRSYFYKMALCNALFVLALIVPYYGKAMDQSEAQANADTTRHIYVVNHGWHTGIIVIRADVDTVRFSIMQQLPAGRFLEIGWGDADFYQNPSYEVDYWLAFKAAVLPTTSVMHIVGFDDPPDVFFGYSGLIKIDLTINGFRDMMDFIVSYFERDKRGHILPLGKGLYGNSRFYKSDRIYIFPKTCNVWTAQALREAGIPLSPYRYQKSGVLMEALREYGRVLRARPED